MDYFYESGSEYKVFTPSDIREIKQMLLSGDRDQILESVEKINYFLNNEESLAQLIRSDVAEFLCNAVIPFDGVLLGDVYNCLESMARHVEFFSHTHSGFIIDSLIRSMHFLMKNSFNTTSLNQCINLLLVVIQGFGTYSVPPEKKTVQNLLRLLPALLKNNLPTVNNIYQMGQLILRLIELGVLRSSQDACEIILTSFSSWFNLLSDILETVHPMREKMILLCSQLCYSVLRDLVSLNDIDVAIPCELQNNIVNNISDFLINFAALYFDGFFLSNVESNHFSIENFYQSTLYFYTNDIKPQKNLITNGLSKVGFIQFTTAVVSDLSEDENLRNLCFIVLFQVILSLSEDLFHIPAIWPRGRDDFLNEIQHGISQLPLDASLWLDILSSPESSPSCKLVILLYLYFYAMTAKSQNILEVIYPSIVVFIHTAEGIESSILLVRLVWFIFAMSQLSNSQNLPPENQTEATNDMISLLEAHDDLSLVYTHHSALLYWALSCDITSSIQSKIVHLWLINKTSDCKELEELIGKFSHVGFYLLNILQYECGQILDAAFSSLKSVLTESKNDDLASNIWFLLPQVLAKFTVGDISATNVDYVIELSSLKTPENIDVAHIIQIASLLPEVLLKSDLISILPSLNLTLRLLEVGLEMEDRRVMQTFLRFDDYVEKILEELRSDVSDICLLSLKIVSLLWKESQEFKEPKHNKIRLSKETILDILENNKVLPAVLHFLQEISLTRFQSPIFKIDADSTFVEILFLDIINISVKKIPNTSVYCWICLKYLLFVGPFAEQSVQGQLLSNPLLHELIRFNLPHLKESQEVKEFLNVWLDLYLATLNAPFFERKIFGRFYSETMRRVADSLGEDLKEEDRMLYEKVLKSGVIKEHEEINAAHRCVLSFQI